jgi:surface antigen
VLGLGDREGCRQSLYNGTAALRLCRRFYELVHRLIPGIAAVATVVNALALCGCSYRLASLVSKDDTDTTTTGSIMRPANQVTRVADASPPAQNDLVYARATAAEVLARGRKDASVPWQNPQSGAGGNITPLDTAYTEDGMPCRDFLASYVHGGAQDWLQGAACRDLRGIWHVTRLAPLKPS